MPTPIANILLRKDFVEIAQLQDETIEGLYELDPKIVLHGGTAIWRCYNGNRFSYDIDAYVSSERELNAVANELTFTVRRRGGQLDKLNIIERTAMGQVSDGHARVKLDIMYQRKPVKSIIKEYTRIDGTLFNVLTLSAEDFIIEKVGAYGSRGYLRDLYDIYHLINYVGDKTKIREALLDFLRDIEKPSNRNDLEMIVYAGVAPSFDEMIDYIRVKLE